MLGDVHMGYFDYALVAFCVLSVTNAIVFLIRFLRIKKAENMVDYLSTEEKIRKLNLALEPFGFAYFPPWDCIISDLYAWQREMGYCKQYDEMAPSMNMIIECEPIYFNYDGRRWLIEFWKGQYGCTTGAEIGIYVNDSNSQAPSEELFYSCVSDEEMLYVQFSLYKKDGAILKRQGLHWWLTGFLLGDCSSAEELIMNCSIIFPNNAMRNAFYEGMIRAGYHGEDIAIEGNKVSLLFGQPKTIQPNKYPNWYIKRKSRLNCKLSKIYLRITRRYETTLDRLSFIGQCFPHLFRILIKLGKKSNQSKIAKYRRKFDAFRD